VENQLDRSNHDHLGKLLTYAGGTDAVNVVWLATEFREEHRAALDWLNSRTDENTRFFAVEIGVVQIGDSVPAPLFRLVVKPNDWGKAVKAGALGDAAGAKNQSYGEFWTRFLLRMAEAGLGWTTSTKGPAANGLTLPAGHSAIWYGCSFSKSGLLSEIYLGDQDPDVNEARFTAALTRKAVLEAAFSGPLSFEPLPGKKACRIAVYEPGLIEESEMWDEYINWFIDTQKRLRVAVASVNGIGNLVAPPGPVS
jgi:hypothetical protein